MRMRSIATLALAGALLGACASDPAADPSRPSAGKPSTLSQRLQENQGFTQDANGNWVPTQDKRSTFEAQGASPYFKGKFEGKTYKTGGYERKSWWGAKNYDRKSYAGKTDGSRFQTASGLSGQAARESRTDAGMGTRYGTGTYATNTAREASGESIARPGDAETAERRRVYEAPGIIDWREQRNLSIEQTRGLLGR